MREITRLILKALADIALLVVQVLVYLAFTEIINWFINLADSIGEDDLAFTLQQEIEAGQFTIIQGVFDQRTDKVKSARRIDAKRLDSKLQDAHAKNDLVIYT